MRWKIILWLGPVLLAGCATSTIQSRTQERYGIYSNLTPEMKSAVDLGQVKVGMPLEAVYIAWGKPSQIIVGESAAGKITTWLYHGTHLQEIRYWSYRNHYSSRGHYATPHLEFDYYPRNYVRAEVVFQDGVVKEWRSLPIPN